MDPKDVLQLQEPLKEGGIRAVNFFNGRLLTAQDLSREQTARREADARLEGPRAAAGRCRGRRAGGAAGQGRNQAEDGERGGSLHGRLAAYVKPSYKRTAGQDRNPPGRSYQWCLKTLSSFRSGSSSAGCSGY